MKDIERVGLLRRRRGGSELLCDSGSFQLTGLSKEAQAWSGFVRVRGELRPDTELAVKSIELLAKAESEKPPHYYGSRSEALRTAGSLRSAAHRYLANQGYWELFLPSAWSRTDERGDAEIRLVQESLDEHELYLQRFPEFSSYLALVSGLSDWYSFGRCWRAQAQFDTHPRDNLLEFEQLTVGRAGWTMKGMLDFATDLICRMAETIELSLHPNLFLQRDLASNGGNFTRTVEFPPSWGSATRDVVLRHIIRRGCRYTLIDCTQVSTPPGISPEEAWGVLIQGPDDSALHIDTMLNSIHSLRTGISSTNHLHALRLHPTWIIHPTVMFPPEISSVIGYKARSLTTARLPGTGDPRMVHADLFLEGLEVGHASFYANREDLTKNMTDCGLRNEIEIDYLLREFSSAPPSIGVVSLGWERLCSRLIGCRDSTETQPFGWLSIGGAASRAVGPAQ